MRRMLVYVAVASLLVPLVAGCGKKKADAATQKVEPNMMKQNMQKGNELMQQGQKAAK
jgi:hypothetical protein